MIIDITPQNFHTDLLEASRTKTIVVFFYADQIPECRPMGTKLEALIGPANTTLTLARVNVADPQLQSIAVQLGLQALPAVVLFQNGQPTDALMGPKQDPEIETFLQKYLPKEEDTLLAEGVALLESGDAGAAYAKLTKAYALVSDRHDIIVTLADASVKTGRVDEAKELLTKIPEVYRDAAYNQVQSAIDLYEQSAESPEILALEHQLAERPDDKDLKVNLAVQYAQAGRKKEALELLYGILVVDLNYGEVKKTFLDILATLGADPMVSLYRKKLYALLY
jgi:putative thioredoxin